jgi:hypothetical protein
MTAGPGARGLSAVIDRRYRIACPLRRCAHFRSAGQASGRRPARIPRWACEVERVDLNALSVLPVLRASRAWGQAAPPTDVRPIAELAHRATHSPEPRPGAGEQQPAAETDPQHELVAGKAPRSSRSNASCVITAATPSPPTARRRRRRVRSGSSGEVGMVRKIRRGKIGNRRRIDRVGACEPHRFREIGFAID